MVAPYLERASTSELLQKQKEDKHSQNNTDTTEWTKNYSNPLRQENRPTVGLLL
jgi:hypothetical protein